MNTEPEFKDQFIYPRNPALKKAYQAIIKSVLDKKRVIIEPQALILDIITHMELIDDSNRFADYKQPGTNYKKVRNILKTFEGKFTKFVKGGVGLEIFIFKLDKTRVSTFQELEYLCSFDPNLSDAIATTQELDLNQVWGDVYSKGPTFSMNDATQELSVLESAKTGDNMNEIIASRSHNFGEKHVGSYTGNNVKSPNDDNLVCDVE